MIERELERRALAREALDKYRELNLLYDVSEKIGASLDVGEVAGVAINEARRLIKRGVGVVLVLDEATGLMSPLEIAIDGDQGPGAGDQGSGPQAGSIPGPRSLQAPSVKLGEGVIGKIVANGRPEVVIDVAADPRSEAADDVTGGPSDSMSEPWRASGGEWEPGRRPRSLRSGLKADFALGRSLICAPLMSKQRVIGAFVIYSAEPVEYTAADLKLLSAIASLAAPAIDNALLYQKTVRESQEREFRLQQQLGELRIEVDQARQARQVAQITSTDYFKSLREQASSLREQLDRG
jgi:GAF domain-containing protein